MSASSANAWATSARCRDKLQPLARPESRAALSTLHASIALMVSQSTRLLQIESLVDLILLVPLQDVQQHRRCSCKDLLCLGII